MSSALNYVLDTNVFIEAYRRYYAFDIVPAFWQALLTQAQNGNLRSIDRVLDELRRNRDELTRWATQQFRNSFHSTQDDQTLRQYVRVIAWVQGQNQFTNTAKDDFADGADGWLVAHALVHSCVVVTQEKASASARKRVPLPNVCQQFGVRCMDTFEMLRALRIRF